MAASLQYPRLTLQRNTLVTGAARCPPWTEHHLQAFARTNDGHLVEGASFNSCPSSKSKLRGVNRPKPASGKQVISPK